MSRIENSCPFRLDDPDTQADPYAYYPELRERRPVYRAEFLGRTHWVISRRKDVSAALMDPKTFSSRTTPIPILLFADPPEHGAMRSLVSSRFTPGAIAEMAGQVREITGTLLDRCLAKGAIDGIGDFASPLTIFMMSRLLGISVDAVENVRALSLRLAENVLAVRSGHAPSAEAAAAGSDMRAFLLGLFERQEFSDDGVLATLVAANRRGDMTDDTLVQFSMLLFVAGHSTTTNLIGNALYTLCRHPDELGRMRADEAYVPRFVEEVLRTRPSFHRIPRVTTRDVELHGETIPAGSPVVLLLAAANRDPAYYEDPEEFDASLERRAHMTFGQGIHSCLGSWLARLESRIALGMLAERAGDIRLDTAHAPEPLTGGTFNEFGFEHLPIVLSAR